MIRPRKKPRPGRLKECKTCGSTYESRDLRGAGYCSPKCFYAQGTKYKSRICRHCGGKFGNRNALLYCSRKCFESHILKRKTIACVVCGTYFERGRPCLSTKTCSSKCMGEYSRKPTVTVKCVGCGVEFSHRPMGNREQKYCTFACSAKHRVGENHHSFRGNRRGYRGANWPRQAGLARDRDSNTCVGCGSSQDKKASVDHIVPFRVAKSYNDSRDPNDLINLACLCRSCHAKKTGAERALLNGDISGFLIATKVIIPLERIEAALSFWGFRHG